MPTPTTPTWISPAEGATVDASALLEWAAGTVANAAPSVAVVAPTAGASVPTGAPLTLAATASDTDGTVAGVTFSVDGGAAIAATFNAGTSRWEASVTPAAGAHSVTATATDDDGDSTTSAAVAFTAEAAPTVIATDFEEGTPVAGAAVPGWDEPWVTSGSITYLDRGAPDGFVLKHHTSASARNVARWTTPGTIADGEVLTLVQTNLPDELSSKTGPGPIVRGSGSSASGSAYFASLTVLADNSHILHISIVGGAVLAQPAFAWVAGADYWIRFRFQGTALKVKVWARGSAEPGAWTWEGTDATNSTGWLGLIAVAISDNQCAYYAAHDGTGTIPVPAELA